LSTSFHNLEASRKLFHLDFMTSALAQTIHSRCEPLAHRVVLMAQVIRQLQITSLPRITLR
jgi:hypothetical protein